MGQLEESKTGEIPEIQQGAMYCFIQGRRMGVLSYHGLFLSFPLLQITVDDEIKVLNKT